MHIYENGFCQCFYKDTAKEIRCVDTFLTHCTSVIPFMRRISTIPDAQDATGESEFKGGD